MLNVFFSQVLNGLAIGNVYSLLALGFSLVFGVANLINFAQGSLFMVGAYLSWMGISHGMSLAVAVAFSVVISMLLGIVIDAVALRPLEGGPSIAPLLSTLAVSVVMDELAQLIWTPETQAFPNPLAGTVWQIGSAYISAIDVLICVIGVTAMLALTMFLSKTWPGRALRAAAQDKDASMQMGVDAGNLRRLAFGLAAGLGALGGAMVGLYYQSIFPAMGLSFGLKGFVAALLGGITSLPGAVAGGMLLGVFESLASGYAGAQYRDLVAFTLLMLLLIWRPQGLLGQRRLAGLGGEQAAAGAVPSTSLLGEGAWKKQSGRFSSRELHLPIRSLLMLLAVAGLLPVLPVGPYVMQVALTGIIFAMLAAGLTVVAGTAGQVSLGHAAFFGIGAYTAALLAKNTGLPLEAVLLIAAALSALLAHLSAQPMLRLTGHAVSIATLAVGQIAYLVMLTWIPVTRGPMGIPGIPAPRLLLLGGRTVGSLQAQYWMAIALLMVLTWASHRLLVSPVGRTWRAVREDRLAAQAAGVPLQRYLPLAFGWGGLVAGVAGALYAYMLTYISPDSFAVDTSILVLTMTVLGGLGNLAGAILGGLLLAMLPEALRGFVDYRMITYGMLLLLTVRFRPRGLARID